MEGDPTPQRSSPHLLLLLVQVCFASLAVVGKEALAHIPPNAIVLARVAGGAVAFYVLARWRDAFVVSRQDLPRLVLCSLLGVTANQLLFLNGLAYSTAINASVLTTTIPVFTLAFALVARLEPFRPARALGIAVALAGTLVLVKVDRFTLADEHIVGNLMIVANSACYAAFLVLVRPLAAKIRPLPLVAILFAIATLLVAPLGVPAWLSMSVSWRDVVYIAFLIAVPTVGAYALNQMAIQRAESSLVAAYIYLQPVFASLGAAWRLGERPTVREGIAAVLIAGGVWVGTRG